MRDERGRKTVDSAPKNRGARCGGIRPYGMNRRNTPLRGQTPLSPTRAS